MPARDAYAAAICWEHRMDKKTREELVRRHAGLVKLIASRIAGHLPEHVDREDLYSAGILGLLKAIDRYDPDRGVKFETYATPLIRGEIMEALRAKDWAPRTIRRRAREVAEAVARLESRLGRPPTSEEIAAELGVSIEEYERILRDTSQAALMSFEEVFSVDDEDNNGTRQVEPPSDPADDPLAVLEQQELKRIIAEAVENLPEREKLVVALYYQEGMTLKEIGEVLSVTESRVCQIHSQAMARLRAAVLRAITI